MDDEQFQISSSERIARLARRCCRFGKLCLSWGLNESYEPEPLFGKAENFFHQALLLDPECLDAQLSLCYLYLLRNYPLRAKVALQQAQVMAPEDERVRLLEQEFQHLDRNLEPLQPQEALRKLYALQEHVLITFE
ncbi:MAG: hypothetical protein CVV27_08920 [Candidatus Melainabacteria bacterium HGW-Melainabacteria-1]|nr:MAG: hypothetical protein CVV27_08920 [Candidatus Melainabacteria bacterium HGW-Melainabacteria-1]